MMDQITLSWPGKEMLLASVGDARYEWIDPQDYSPRALDDLLVEQRTLDEPHGTVVCGDGLDLLAQCTSPLADGSVRLVYVDPPFNKGVVFGDYEDVMDSGQWLSMLKDRLVATKRYLRPDASVWVHLDDSESHRARCVLDEIFGAEAYVATIVWQRKMTRESRSAISTNHDSILVPNHHSDRTTSPAAPWSQLVRDGSHLPGSPRGRPHLVPEGRGRLPSAQAVSPPVARISSLLGMAGSGNRHERRRQAPVAGPVPKGGGLRDSEA